jgi:CRP-like cAMP-binding protein
MMNEALKEIGTITQFAKDEVIFMEGEMGTALYILLSGKVMVSKQSDFDGESIVLAELEAGAVFGEMAVIRDHFRSATLTAVSPVITLRIARENFSKFIMLEPRYAHTMLKTLAVRIQSVRKKCEERSLCHHDQ